MYHTIEFVSDVVIDLDESSTKKQMRVRKGTRFQAWLQPHVIDVGKCPVEVADVHLSNGTILRLIPYGFFLFVE
jgi:hypothetical protein